MIVHCRKEFISNSLPRVNDPRKSCKTKSNQKSRKKTTRPRKIPETVLSISCITSIGYLRTLGIVDFIATLKRLGYWDFCPTLNFISRFLLITIKGGYALLVTKHRKNNNKKKILTLKTTFTFFFICKIQ